MYSGAAATYRVLRYAPGRKGWWWMYAHVPGFAAVAEWAYAFFARRRGSVERGDQVACGAVRSSRIDTTLVSWLFLRGLGLVYFAAFASLAVQILGLVGSAGVLPLEPFLQAAHEYYGIAALSNRADAVLAQRERHRPGRGHGCGDGARVARGVGDCGSRRAGRVLALYLSYVYAGQAFMTFQWDLLLLEVGFLAIFLTGGSRIVVWLYRWLLFRYMFMAGAAKLLSGDPTWRNLTALEYHFETQPLPTPLAWYAAHLPHWVLAGGTAATLIIEVGVVFLIFAPRRVRAVAAWCVLGFQSS